MRLKTSLNCYSIVLTFISIIGLISSQFCDINVNLETVENINENILVLVNGKHVLKFENAKIINHGSIVLPTASVFMSEGNHSIAVYSSDDSNLYLIGLNDVFISSDEYRNCVKLKDQQIRHKRNSPNDHSIGVQYSVWHGFAANAVFNMQRAGTNISTVETLIRDGKSLADYWSHGVKESDSLNGYYQVQPKRGFYCVYRKRSSEQTGVKPDCPNIEQTLLDHANTLFQSGVDYIYVDLTNLCTKSPSEDLIQRRPMEVLFEEWQKLRTQGKQTPQIVAWNRIDNADCTTWRDYLDMYDKYPDLVWKDSKTGKKIFMATKDSNQTIKQQIESNNGKNDIIVVNNWVANVNESRTGRWQFMGWCGAESDKPSTDIVSRSTCDQAVTRNSPIGDQISTGISYQMNYASAPWGSSTSYYGLTFLLQWDTALRVSPHHITISGWNEFMAGVWDNPWKGFTKSMGLTGGDNRLFVDLYGAHRSRDIEPTVECGNSHLDLMQSCIRVRNLNLHNNRNDCSVQNEVCCQLNRFKQFVQIYSYFRNDKKDYLLTNNANDKQALNGFGYSEVCSINGATRDFCSNGNPNDDIVGVSGSFVMFNKDGPDRKAIYRCNVANLHFMSLDANCESTKTEYLLGYVSTKKDSLFARSIRRCTTNDNVHYHALDHNCHPNDKQEADIFGYVI